jgi:hypothetical protein
MILKTLSANRFSTSNTAETISTMNATNIMTETLARLFPFFSPAVMSRRVFQGDKCGGGAGFDAFQASGTCAGVDYQRVFVPQERNFPDDF